MKANNKTVSAHKASRFHRFPTKRRGVVTTAVKRTTRARLDVRERTMKTTTEKLVGIVFLWLAVSSLPGRTDAYSSLAGSCDHAGVIHGEENVARAIFIFSLAVFFSLIARHALFDGVPSRVFVVNDVCETCAEEKLATEPVRCPRRWFSPCNPRASQTTSIVPTTERHRNSEASAAVSAADCFARVSILHKSRRRRRNKRTTI